MINGTTNGTKTNAEGQTFLELAAFTIIKYGQIFGTPIQTKIKVATINDSFLQNTGGNGQTFSGKVTIKRVGGLEVQNGSVSRTNSNPRGSMDNVQGGRFNTQGIIKDEFTLALNDAVDSQEWRQYLANHAFIPSVSALAFKNPNFDWSSAINRNLVCDPANKEIYFDTYFAPSTNQDHVFVSAENANWLIKELQGNPQTPWFPLQDSSIIGPDILCDTPNTVYSIPDLCKVPSSLIYTNQSGATVNGWSVSSNLQIVSSTATSVTVSPLQSGSGTITATFQNGETLSKTITVYHVPSLPIPSGSFYVDFVDCYHDGALPINYNPDVYFGGVITLSPSVLPHPLQSQTKNITVRYTNPCTSAYTTKVITFNYQAPNCSGRMSNDTSFYSIYPNPSNDIVTIDLRDQNSQPEKGATISGELFDMMGQSKSKVGIVDNKAIFSVKGLEKGIYVLKIYINGQVESHQIAVD